MKQQAKKTKANARLALFEFVCQLIRKDGRSVEEIARRSKVAPATIYFWLIGQTQTPRLNTLVRVARVLGYEVELVKRQPVPFRVIRGGKA